MDLRKHFIYSFESETIFSEWDIEIYLDYFLNQLNAWSSFGYLTVAPGDPNVFGHFIRNNGEIFINENFINGLAEKQFSNDKVMDVYIKNIQILQILLHEIIHAKQAIICENESDRKSDG